MHILVTGGAGYIGGTAAEALLAAGHQVTVLDNLSHGHRAAVPAGARFVHGDLLDRAGVADLLASEPYEAVMHFAALIEAGESMQRPGAFFANNVTGSLNLLEEAVRHGVRRLVFSSTAALFAGSDQPLSEAAPIQPANVYGETKRVVEQMLGWYHKVHGLRYAALRYFNAAGALPHRGEAHQPESHLIPRVLAVALGQAEAVKLFGTDYPTPDGTCIRDYIHIADLVSAHLLVLEALGDGREALAYNLGNGAGYSIRQVIETAREVTGHPIPVVEQPRRPGDAPRLVAACDKIKAELGWRPRFGSLRDILGTAWEWHRTHPRGYA
ncbi:MAG: UDP-glucose 4-epimerase GalE [Anaerolineales bacterium]|nr:UDP-glucose 4-epimerase GalE [Anaerolineales bacterium]